jgi:hypothetical protein
MQRMIAGRVVVDRKGLTGNYLRLPYSPPSLSADAGAPPADSLSIFTALREQLGLTLEAATGKVQAVVIDHIDRPWKLGGLSAKARDPVGEVAELKRVPASRCRLEPIRPGRGAQDQGIVRKRVEEFRVFESERLIFPVRFGDERDARGSDGKAPTAAAQPV